MQGLLQWTRGGSEPTRVLANRVSASSKLQPGSPILYANSVDVSPTTGKIYFTSSSDVPPALGTKGFYDTLASSILTFAGVRP